MANITKKIGRHIPSNQRQQIFTQVDASAGDIIMVKDSLGRPANKVNITANSAMYVRFNVRHLIPKKRTQGDGLVEGDAFNLHNSIWATTEDNALIVLSDGETYELDNDFPVNDIQLDTVSGVFEIIVS